MAVIFSGCFLISNHCNETDICATAESFFKFVDCILHKPDHLFWNSKYANANDRIVVFYVFETNNESGKL